MSLKSDTKKKLKDLGFDVDKLIAAIKHDDEQDYSLPEVIAESDMTERDKNTAKEARAEGFKEGKGAGIEIANKAVAKKYGLTDVDVKDPDKVIAALDSHVAKGDTGLKEQISLLQKDKELLATEREAAIKKAESIGFDTDLIMHFPSNRTADLTDKERLLLIKGSIEFADEDGVKVAKKDGQVLRDSTTRKPLPIKDAISGVFKERKWVTEQQQGGRGGNDQQSREGAGLKKRSQVQEKWEASNPGKAFVSPEGQAYTEAIAKDTSDFDWHN